MLLPPRTRSVHRCIAVERQALNVSVVRAPNQYRSDEAQALPSVGRLTEDSLRARVNECSSSSTHWLSFVHGRYGVVLASRAVWPTFETVKHVYTAIELRFERLHPSQFTQTDPPIMPCYSVDTALVLLRPALHGRLCPDRDLSNQP